MKIKEYETQNSQLTTLLFHLFLFTGSSLSTADGTCLLFNMTNEAFPVGILAGSAS